jgi:hypothetical protein
VSPAFAFLVLFAVRDYVGVEACGKCHAAALDSWKGSAHARASTAAVLGPRASDPGCLTCHATGDGANARARLAGVECEACHGAGASYAFDDVMRDPTLARAVGLRDARTSCARCHTADSTTSPAPFDYATAWKKIQH